MTGRLHDRAIGFVAFALFLCSVPASNWLIGNVGTRCPPNEPCLIPVAPGVMAPSGVVAVGLALVLRDVVQRCLGVAPGFIAVLCGALVSVLVAPQDLVVASATAFLLSELADLFVYTPLQRRGLVRAVLASSVVGLLVDSAVFLHLAFGSLAYLPGLVIGKLWGVLASLPFIHLMRRYVRPATG